MTTYRLKISLVEPHCLMSEFHRIVDVADTTSFAVLYQKIAELFECSPIKDWRFFISQIKADNLEKLKQYDCIDEQKQAVIGQMALDEKAYFYLKDERFLCRIRIEKIFQNSTTDEVILVKSVGSPPVFAKNHTNPTQSREEKQFEASLISAMILIARDDPIEPVRWQMLVDFGVADELVGRGVIKPCASPSHRVRLTAFGESELARVIDMMGDRLKDELSK